MSAPMSGLRTARYAVVGMPVAHSLSPVMQQAAFHAAGLHATYEAIESDVAQAPELFDRLRAAGYAGWNVTTPLKDAAFSLVDQVSDEARAARAVNAVRNDKDGTLQGHETDGLGLVQALVELWSWDPYAGTALVLGAGPAARAAIESLRTVGATVSCWARDAERAARLAPPIADRPALVVSALAPDATVPDFILHAADDDTMIFDCNYGRDGSPVAAMRGRRRTNGLPLLLHQGALSFTWWTGKAAPLDAMRAALEAHRR
ncbi:MAG: shikimate dehydrogenase [Candidatus Eremiobacteraeota bacterium]|nr:shikimate dehydrogenase [Candidatus Eremiobacteraeota bacterium]